MDMLDILHRSLQKLSQNHTEETLGDRKSYLGASDVGGCPRKVILERINPSEHDLATLLRFQRGHMAENIIADAYTAGGYTNFKRQVEIDISTDLLPALVHIDFVFTQESIKTKSILEIKSGKVPDEPYSSWETQLYIQMGALAQKYPDYKIKGAVLSIDLSEGDVGFFNGYKPEDELYGGLIQRAESIWTDYRQTLEGQIVDFKTEPTPLCGFCNHIRTCPRFEADDFEHPEMIEYVNEFQGFRCQEKVYKNRVANHKKALLGMVQSIGNFRSGGYLFKKATRTRQNLNRARLSQFLADYGVSISEFEEASTFSFLDIKKVPEQKQRKAA